MTSPSINFRVPLPLRSYLHIYSGRRGGVFDIGFSVKEEVPTLCKCSPLGRISFSRHINMTLPVPVGTLHDGSLTRDLGHPTT